MIAPVGQWVIRAACRQIRDWLRAGFEPVPVAINLSARQFQLPALGLRIAIDYFGTGYSSLSYLKRFPIDDLKLDGLFVGGMPNGTGEALIARTIVALAHSPNLRGIAEGVENEAQPAALASDGCDEYQGYGLSRPLPGSEFTRYLRKRDKRSRAV